MHSINTILIRKSEIRNSKINSILDGNDLHLDIPYLELPEDIIVFPTLSKKEVVNHFGPDVNFVYVETDYFGGDGDQSASLNRTISKEKFGQKFIKQSDLDRGYITISDGPRINDILKEYGVQRTNGNDEFDTIHLGRYRQNKDFLHETEYWKKTQKSLIDQIVKNTKSF